MKRIIAITLGAAALVCLSSCKDEKPASQLKMLVGTYTEGTGSEGVYMFDFNSETAEYTLLDTARTGNPSFIIPAGERAYAVSEFNDGRQGVCSFLLREDSIDVLNFRPGTGEDPCNIVLVDGNVITSDYTGGKLSVFPVLRDGSLDSMSFQFIPELRSSDTVPHIHCTAVSPDGKYIFVTDLGSDFIYRAELNGRGLPPWNFEVAYSFDAAGHPGPRHLTFSEDGKFAYLINELGDIISAFRYNEGELELISSAIAYSGEGHGSADIHISPDGNYVYTSHRLKGEGIAIFKRNKKTGELTPAGFQPTGKHPRNFAISPDGNLLLCACRDDNRIEIYSIDKKTGALTDTGKTIEVPAPVCIQMY